MSGQEQRCKSYIRNVQLAETSSSSPPPLIDPSSLRSSPGRQGVLEAGMPAGGTERGVQCPSPLAKRRRRAELSCELARRQERLLEAEHRLLERPSGEARILGKLEQRLAETESRILSGSSVGVGGRRTSEQRSRLQLPHIPENLLQPNGSCSGLLSPRSPRLLSTETLDRVASQSCSTISGWDIEASEMAIDYRGEYGALHEYSRVGSQYGLHPLKVRREEEQEQEEEEEEVVNEHVVQQRTSGADGEAVKVRGECAVRENGLHELCARQKSPNNKQHDPGISRSGSFHSNLGQSHESKQGSRKAFLEATIHHTGPASPREGGRAPLAQFRYWVS